MKKIKNEIASFIYRLLIFIAKILPAKEGKNHLLIIKLDEIGDYMLFRNFLKYFKDSEQYGHHKITLLGNVAWKPIFDEYDSENVDHVIWVTKKKFNKSLSYRFSLLKQVRRLETSDVINCVFSRFFILEDGFAFLAKGKNKIAMTPEKHNANRGRYTISLDRQVYTKIVNAGDEKIFDVFRNRNYMKILTGKNLPVTTHLLAKQKYDIPDIPYFVVFIGAGNMIERKWPVDNFVKCTEYIYAKWGLLPFICGSPLEEKDGELFREKYKGENVNYVGKTTLPQFIEIVSRAKFLLSVDTGPVHMAAASGCPVVGLYSGVHYGRYAPYPKEVATPFYSIYPDYIDELVKENNDMLYNPFIMKNESIKSITIDKVIPYIDKVMNA